MRNNKVIECAVKMLKSKCRKRRWCRIFVNIQLSVCNRSRNRQIPGFKLNRVHGTNFVVNFHATPMCLLKEPQSTVQIIPTVLLHCFTSRWFSFFISAVFAKSFIH